MKSELEELEDDFGAYRHTHNQPVSPLGLTRREMAGVNKSLEHRRKLQVRYWQIKKENEPK